MLNRLYEGMKFAYDIGCNDLGVLTLGSQCECQEHAIEGYLDGKYERTAEDYIQFG